MSAPNILNLTEANFDNEVLKSTVPVVVDFWAEWCGPCKQAAPVLDELAGEFDNRVRVGKVNVDDSQQLAAQFGVNSIPTFLMFKNGEVTGQIVGLVSKRELKGHFEKLIA